MEGGACFLAPGIHFSHFSQRYVLVARKDPRTPAPGGPLRWDPEMPHAVELGLWLTAPRYPQQLSGAGHPQACGLCELGPGHPGFLASFSESGQQEAESHSPLLLGVPGAKDPTTVSSRHTRYPPGTWCCALSTCTSASVGCLQGAEDPGSQAQKQVVTERKGGALRRREGCRSP